MNRKSLIHRGGRCLLYVVFFIFLIIALLLWVNREQEYNTVHQETQGVSVTYVLIDGLSNKVFKTEMQNGNLPNLQRMAQDGIYVVEGIGSFPSMTGYAFYPFITGMDAHRSGIYGLRWFDRSLEKGNLRNYVGATNVRMNEDIDTSIHNVFQDHIQYYTASHNSFMNQGVHHSIKTGWTHASAKYFEHFPFTWLKYVPIWGDDISMSHYQHETQAKDLAIKQMSMNPKVQWVSFAAPDAYHHLYGLDSMYVDLVKHIDGLIGELRQAALDFGQKRVFCIISDHGVMDVGVNINVPTQLEQKIGLKLETGPSTHILSSKLNRPKSDLDAYDGHYVINGNLSAYIYLRNPMDGSWSKKLDSDILENYIVSNDTIHLPNELIALEGMDLVAYRKNKNQIICITKEGRMEIRGKSDSLDVVKVEGNPMGYINDTLLQNMMEEEYFHRDEWLAASKPSDYPDALHRLYELVIIDDVGDLVLCSKEGYDLAADYELFVGNYKGGHGGLHKKLISTPQIISGYGINPLKISYARSEDIGATIKYILSSEKESSLDGKVLIQQ